MKLGLACILLSVTGVLIGSTVYFFVCSQLALAVVNFAYVLSKINNVTFNTVLLSTSFSPRIYILNTLLAMLLGLFFFLLKVGDPLIPSLIALSSSLLHNQFIDLPYSFAHTHCILEKI